MPDCYQVLFVQRRKGSLGVGQIKEDFTKRGEIFKFKLKLTGNSMSIRRNDMSKGIEVLDMPYVKKHSQPCTRAEKRHTPSLTQNPILPPYPALFSHNIYHLIYMNSCDYFLFP